MKEKERVKKGEKYWYILLDHVENGVRDNNDYDTYVEKLRFESGNYFHIKEEAEAMARKLRAVLDGAEVIEKPVEKEIHYIPLMHDLTDVLDDGRY